MACPDDRKILLATDLDPNVFACDNGTITLKADPLPTASVYVAPGQPCDAVDVNLGYAKSDDCALPGGQTAGPWTLKNGIGAVIASGDDLEGVITLPNLCSEPLPFEFSYQVTDACGTSFPAESFGFTPAPAIPTATVLVDPNQWCGGVGITLGYAANPSCPTPGQTAGSWVIKDNLGATVASGTDLAGALPPQDLCAETGPFTLEATVTDACGTSATVIEPFATVPALPTAGVTVPAGQQCDTATADFTHTADPACPVGTQTAGSYVIKDSGGTIVFGPTAQLAGTGITLPDLCAYADPQETLTIEYTTTDSCGTSSAPATADFVVDPVPTGITVPVVDSSNGQQLTCCTDSFTIEAGDSGHSFVGSWLPVGGSSSAFNGDWHYSNSPADKSVHLFTGLAGGVYNVYASWHFQGNLSDAAPYTVIDSDGITTLATVTTDHKNPAAADYVESGTNFELLATVTISGTSLTVELSPPGAFVAADAIHIESACDCLSGFCKSHLYDNALYPDYGSLGTAIAAAELTTTTATVRCDNGLLVADVDFGFVPTQIELDPYAPTAGVSIAPGQNFDSVDITLDYTSNPICPGSQTTGFWELLVDGSPTGLSGTDLEGPLNIDLTAYIPNGLRGSSYPADFHGRFAIRYVVEDDCAPEAGETTVDFDVEVEIVDIFDYTGADQLTTDFDDGFGNLGKPVWANNMEIRAWGAGGGGDEALPLTGTKRIGGAGGYTTDTIPAQDGAVVVGEGGYYAQNTNTSPPITAPASPPGHGFGGSTMAYYDTSIGGLAGSPTGSGGGLTGMFSGLTTVLSTENSRALVVAGGGGGSVDDDGLNGILAYGGSGNDPVLSGGEPTMQGQNAFINTYGDGGGGGGYNGGSINYNLGLSTNGQTWSARGGTGFASVAGSIQFSPPGIPYPPNQGDAYYKPSQQTPTFPVNEPGVGVGGQVDPAPAASPAPSISRVGGHGRLVIIWTP